MVGLEMTVDRVVNIFYNINLNTDHVLFINI